MQSYKHVFDKASIEPYCPTCEHRRHRMFCNLPPDALIDFEAISETFHHAKGVLLFREGGDPQAVHVLCSGQVKSFCNSEEGRTLIVKIGGPGDVLGLSAVISNSPYEVSAETLDSVMLKRIRAHDFMEFLAKYGEVSLHTAQVLAQDYQTVLADARRLALSGSAAGKVAHVLLEWGRYSTPCAHEQNGNGDAMQYTMSLTHEELANIAGTSRETVTRLLSQFKRDGIIETKGSRLTICKPKTLEALIA